MKPLILLLAFFVLSILPAESLFLVGHSLVNHDLPHMLKEMMAAGRVDDPVVEVQVINGSPLKWNGENSEKAFDVLIFTPASPIQEHLKGSDPGEVAARFYERALTANPDCQLYLYVTWPTRNPDQWKQPSWELERIMDYKGMQEVADALTKRFPDQPPVKLLPASTAIRELLDAIQAGQVPGITEASGIFADDIHLTAAGNYYMSCFFYGMLTGRTPIGIPTSIQGRWGEELVSLPQDSARFLQQLAWQTVREKRKSAPGLVLTEESLAE